MTPLTIAALICIFFGYFMWKPIYSKEEDHEVGFLLTAAGILMIIISILSETL